MSLGLVGIAFTIAMIAEKVQAKLLFARFDGMGMIVDIGPFIHILQQ